MEADAELDGLMEADAELDGLMDAEALVVTVNANVPVEVYV
jgi:hypothetical protein